MTPVPSSIHMGFPSPEVTPAIRIIALLVEVFKGMAIKQMGNVIALKLDDCYSITMTLGAEATVASIVSETKATEGLVVAALNKSIHRMALRNDTWDDFVGWVSLAKTVYDRELRQRATFCVARDWFLSPHWRNSPLPVGSVWQVESDPVSQFCKLRRVPPDGHVEERSWLEATQEQIQAAVNDGTIVFSSNLQSRGIPEMPLPEIG